MRLKLTVIFAAMFCLPGCNGGVGSAPPTGSIYRSGLGNFTCKVPWLERPGAREQEHSDADSAGVSFSDDMGRLLRIESGRMPSELTPLLVPDRVDQTLDRFFDANVFPNEFLAASPESSVMYRRHVTTSAGSALFAMVNIPEASTLADSSTRRRLDSVRGVLVFSTKGFLYILQNQEWPAGANIDHGSFQDRANRLLADLQETVGGMSFSDK